MAARNEIRVDRARSIRVGGLLTALLAAVGLVLLPPPAGGQAQADTGGNSSVTESGVKGTYDDFSRLKVTVDQTRDLRGQGVHITWTGGTPTQAGGAGAFGSDYLQFMQCWGDSASGPERDQCAFGQGPTGGGNQTNSRNVGYPAGTPSLYDPNETQYPAPAGSSGPGTVPFRTVKGVSTTNIQTYFTPLTTTEQPYATTGPDGTGETTFQLESAVEADFLGCGNVTNAQAHVQPCWLVVVPRGSHSSDGTPAAQSTGTQVDGSPLSASNWAQRIVFRLDFKPIGAYCPIGQKEQQTIGSEMTTEAMGSWQPTLCVNDKITYGFVQRPEDYSRSQIVSPVAGSAGLAFVQSPVVVPPGSPPVVHAPVSISGLAIGYNIQFPGSSKQRPRLRLNARLVAKLLTASYQCDIPGASSDVVRGGLPAGNPRQLISDPEFAQVNPDFGPQSPSAGCNNGLNVPQGNADYAALLWRWLRSDSAAKAFLDGKPDPWGMRINARFQQLGLGSDTSMDQFPKADPTVWVPNPLYPNLSVGSVGLNPYAQDLHDDAVRVRRANNTAKTLVDQSTPPKLSNSAPLPGQYFELGLTDTATASRYRLGTAELLNADGQFVAPTSDAMIKAVSGMKAGPVPGVLDQNPGLRTSGAYPLTALTYAAASTALDKTVRGDFGTLIRYATGPGQQSGIGNGLLPPGYAPLTAALRGQALTAADDLIAGKVPTTTGGSAGGGSTTGGSTVRGGVSAGGTGGAGAGGTAAGTTAAGATTGGSPSATPAAATTKGGTAGPGAGPPADHVAETGGTTPTVILGAIRWVLLIVLIAGVAGSLAGPLLMRAGIVRAGRAAAAGGAAE